MSDRRKDVKHFPEISSKLAAPTKKSQFERQREEAEAKRLREEAETAAVYNDFVKSFDDEEDDTGDGGGRAADEHSTGGAAAVAKSRTLSSTDASAPRIPAGPSKRHFAPGGRASGPGSLGPPPSLSRKRPFEESRPDARHREQGLFAFEDAEPADAAAAFRASAEGEGKGRPAREDERAVPKPTMQLSSLPPGTSPDVIRSLVPPLLKVEGVRMIPSSHAGPSERKSMASIVTLASETPANDIDSVVSSLQGRYLGWGFNLSISRHLSSATLGSMSGSASAVISGTSSRPFNAQQIPQEPAGRANRAGPQHPHHGGIAPPTSYAPAGQIPRGAQYHVRVSPPKDIKQLRLIHKTLEALITHGPEFEALLMSRPDVQRDEKWAWLWNPRSPGGVWYRWRLWEILTGTSTSKGERGRDSHRLFDGQAVWSEPEELLPFEFTTRFDALVSDSDYNSSDEDESGEEDNPRKRRRQFHAGRGPPPEGMLSAPSEEQTFLNPLQKAKLTHLLARLPTSTARLRRGDVARVTAFVVSHAGRGAEEIVDMLVSNVVRPFSCSRRANPDPRGGDAESDGVEGKDDTAGPQARETASAKEDTTPSTLIALHCISDVLSASSTAGVRHSWRYRALFESALKSRKVFSFLGRLEKTMGWGRLRAEKWRRSINGVLGLWEVWCVFPTEAHEGFVKELEEAVRKDDEEQEERARLEKKRLAKEGGKSRWKAVDPNDGPAETLVEPNGHQLRTPAKDGNGDAMEGVVRGGPAAPAEALSEIESVGKPGEQPEGLQAASKANNTEAESTLESKPVTSAEANASAAEGDAALEAALAPTQNQKPDENMVTKARRNRPRAEDMFADSDGE